jgi:hypothetical protein
MRWIDVRQQFPHQWLVVEALQAHSEAGRRQLEELAIVDTFADSDAAWRAYLKLHRSAPERELYVLHTDRQELDITERAWLGVRAAGMAGVLHHFAKDRPVTIDEMKHAVRLRAAVQHQRISKAG